MTRFKRESFYFGLTHTVNPQPWFVESFAQMRDGFAERFEEQYRAKAADLGNYNLGLGQMEGDPPSYSLAVKTHQRWQELLQGREKSAS